MEGFAYRLRPVNNDDASFIVELRNDQNLNRFLHRGAQDAQSQKDWLEKYYERPGDFYFAIERRSSGNAEGLISIYDVDDSRTEGEWGRWILTDRSLAAVESAYLIYRTAFEALGLHSVYCRTVRDNEKVVSFHDSCGPMSRRILHGHFDLPDGKADGIEHRLFKDGSGPVLERLEKLAQLTARMVDRG